MGTDTKQIVELVEKISGLMIEFETDNSIFNGTLNPEKINYDYFEYCNKIESYCLESFLENKDKFLDKLIFILNRNLVFWSDIIERKGFSINFTIENTENQCKISESELLEIAEIKTNYIKQLLIYINDLLTYNQNSVINENDKTPSTINNDDKKIKIAKEIDNLINSMDINKQWEKVFFEKTDYENYKDILVNFFNDTNSNIPKIEIKIRPNSKSSIIGIFKSLHDKYTSFAGHMKDDKNLMELVKILSLFKNDSDDDIIKRIQSNAIKP